jgi:hypothetical protein
MPVVFQQGDRKPPPMMYCGGCGYVLNGLMNFNCPECGRAFNPSIAGSFLTEKSQPVKQAIFRYLKTLIISATISSALTATTALMHRVLPINSPWHSVLLTIFIICLILLSMIMTYRAASVSSSKLTGANLGTSLGVSLAMIVISLLHSPINIPRIMLVAVGLTLIGSLLLLVFSMPTFAIARANAIARAKKNRSATDVRSDSNIS